MRKTEEPSEAAKAKLRELLRYHIVYPRQQNSEPLRKVPAKETYFQFHM